MVQTLQNNGTGHVIRQLMNILLLNYEFPPLGGGGATVSAKIAQEYSKAGHTVDVLTMSFTGLPKKEQKYGATIYRVPCIRGHMSVSHPWEHASYVMSAFWFYHRYLKNNQYDIAHCHFIIPTGLLAWLLKKVYNLKYILSAHGSDVLGYNKRFAKLYPLVKPIWRKIVFNAQEITAPSQFLKSKITEQIDLPDVHIVPNGIEPQSNKPELKKDRILIVGRLVESKDVSTIIAALSNVDLTDWHVDIVGDGPCRRDLERQVAALQLHAQCTFHGWLDNQHGHLTSMYSQAKIFISASRFESFGLAVLEAIAANCYPLLSDIDGHRNITSDDKYFFPVGNIEALAAKLSPLLKDTDSHPQIDISRFYWHTIISKFLKLCEQ